MVFIPLLIWIHKLVTSYVVLHTGQFLYPRRRNHFQNGGNDSGPSWFLASMQRIKEREISNEILKKRNPKLGVTVGGFKVSWLATDPLVADPSNFTFLFISSSCPTSGKRYRLWSIYVYCYGGRYFILH